MKAAILSAVVYLRMSSDQQEESIERQRTEVYAFAAKEGYSIVREYVDEGKSGSLRTEERKSFLQMIDDASKKDFAAVLCWDIKRFGRLDPLKAAAYKDKLKSSGVYIHTCKEGKIQWNKFQDYVVDVVMQAAAHEYSTSLSADSISGRLRVLSQGQNPNGKVPYGYDRLYVSPDGKEYSIRRNENFKKPKGWKRYLVINEDEAVWVKFIFEEYVNSDTSMREIAKHLTCNRPDGTNKPWTRDTVKATLTNKSYAGFAHIGGLRGRLRAKEAHNRFGYHEQAGSIPALVDMATWQKAQDKIEKNLENKTKVQPARSSPLSGVLVCGHCGYRLDKHSRTDKQGDRYAYFSCSSAIKRPVLGCKQWRVREEHILPLVIDRLIQEVDRAILERLNSKPDDSSGISELDSLKSKLDEITKNIDRGTANYLEAPANLKHLLETKLNEWIAEHEQLEREQRNMLVTEGEVTGFAKWWQSVKEDLVTVLPPSWRTQKQSVCGDQVIVTPLDSEAAKSLPANGTETINGKEYTYAVGDYPIKPAIMVESSRFRNLLKSLGFKVTLTWKPQTVTKKGKTYESDRFYELDKAVIEAKASAPSEHFMGGLSSRYSRARSRDRD